MQTGVDTYVTVAEADTYISAHYRSAAAERTRWKALSDDDKAVLLLSACEDMERLPFRGRKYELDQPLQFPRTLFGFDPSPDIPSDVKAAQIEYALWLSDDDKRVDEEQRRSLQAQGIKSFSLGDLKEDYAPGSPTEISPLSCPRAKLMLSHYTNGGYATC